MIFYLEHGDKFHIFYNNEEVIFVHFSTVLNAPTKSAVRWFGKTMFKNEHMKKIISFMQSEQQSDRNIGKAILEQTLKVRIIGEIIGWEDG